ncbi:Transglutaminase-like enzyme, putative cysteine protease [Cribrihabitans marinus]|uniref:Transglutaminase-like enzyme, putative cysteine protease n=1 Tax=Cribrihabitans marinus TaxID=1227549 RepID=A0A1H6TZE3_9RHOB|nr:transglutaminase family protein [Cribrihabitans marinus]GGH21109.1 transglutaminase [Cribrihabitans marinus]SEI85413.1 Transglutaminase-like enzyme, putative cysteine protease [Cribrihabitans marinus]
MRLKIQHSTRYRFETPVNFGLLQLRKTPKSSNQQAVIGWQTRVENGRKELSFEDHHNNATELISFAPGATEMDVISEGEVELTDTAGIVGPHRGPAPLWLYQKDTPLTRAGAGARALLRRIGAEPTLDGLHALVSGIRESIAYEIGVSHTGWDAEDAIAAGRGVCQDHSHVFLVCARELGFPARYVSGYLMLDDQTAQDAMHAWAEAHVDGLGWVGFDVSNGISPDSRYVRVATGLDYADASPVSGTRVGGTGESLEVRIDVAQQ